MGFTNSSLATYTNLSPNYSTRTQTKITKITIHHMAAKWTAKQCCDSFAKTSRKASANYCVGYDGSIGLCVEEKNRAWTSSSSWNDQRAVTIEVGNDEIGGNWHVADVAVQACINLVVDICKRNGIKSLTFDGTKNGSLTWHCFYASTACPGPYMKSITPYIVEKVNEGIAGTNTVVNPSNPYPRPTGTVKSGAKNNHVKWIQFQLNTFGYGLVVDGAYGTATTNSIKDFQSKHKLTVTGNCDTKTIAALAGEVVAGTYVSGGVDYRHTFDPVFYNSKYPDLANSFKGDATKLFKHYIEYGIKEMRQASATFDVQVYAARYADLRNAFGALSAKTAKKYVDHYNTNGYNEGRIAI